MSTRSCPPTTWSRCARWRGTSPREGGRTMERGDHHEDGRPVNPTNNPTFESVLAARLSRRDLLRGAAAGLVSLSAASLTRPRPAAGRPPGGGRGRAAATRGKVVVPPGSPAPVLL